MKTTAMQLAVHVESMEAFPYIAWPHPVQSNPALPVIISVLNHAHESYGGACNTIESELCHCRL